MVNPGRLSLMRYRAHAHEASRHEPSGNGRVRRVIPLDTTLPHGATLSATGLHLPTDLNVDAWAAVGVHLVKLDTGIQWALGDWWVYGGHKYGERVAVAKAEALPYEFGSLMNLGRVARRVETSRRSEVLSYSHHVEVAKLKPSEQKKCLDMATRCKWSVKQLRRSIQEDPPKKDDSQVADDARREAVSLWSLCKRVTNLTPFIGVWEPPMWLDHLDDHNLRETVERVGRSAKVLAKVADGLDQYQENRKAQGDAFVPRQRDDDSPRRSTPEHDRVAGKARAQ